MYDLGDELTIESLRIPWLIWIQVVVLFLLIFLIYCLTNLSDHNSSSISSSSSSQLVPNETQKDKPLPNHNFTTRAVTNLSQNHRVRIFYCFIVFLFLLVAIFKLLKGSTLLSRVSD